jgi:hypothetical protein
MWIELQFDDDGEIVNQEFVDASDDSYFWVRGRSLHKVVPKLHINVYGCGFTHISRVFHPEDSAHDQI